MNDQKRMQMSRATIVQFLDADTIPIIPHNCCACNMNSEVTPVAIHIATNVVATQLKSLLESIEKNIHNPEKKPSINQLQEWIAKVDDETIKDWIKDISEAAAAICLHMGMSFQQNRIMMCSMNKTLNYIGLFTNCDARCNAPEPSNDNKLDDPTDKEVQTQKQIHKKLQILDAPKGSDKTH